MLVTMMLIRHAFAALFLVATAVAAPQALVSPGGQSRVDFSLPAGEFHYAVTWNGEPVLLPSKLGFVFKQARPLDGPFEIVKRESRVIDETWSPVWGQVKSIRNHASETTFRLRETEAPHRLLDVVFRAYDDGVAFRYHLPVQPHLKDFRITDELTTFRFAEDVHSWWVEDTWDTYERNYAESPLSRAAAEGMNTPATFKTSRGTYLSLHEADLTDWAGMTLKRAEGAPELSLEAALVPWYGSEVKVVGKTPHSSPWRTVQLAKTPGGLVTSNLIQNCNDPCKIEDTSWIEPTKYMGIWWGCITGVWNWELAEDPDKHGATTARAKRYIDACARHGIKHLLIEGWCEGWEGGIPGWRKMNMLKPYRDFDMEEIVRYGRAKGVSLVGHHETGGDIPNYLKQLPEAFEYYRRHGIDRIKTGYVTGDKEVYTEGLTKPGREHHHGQFMVRHYQAVVELAAKHRIMIDSHEPIKATGISRTWPNYVAREGARGGEFNHFIGNPPSQTCTLPFTRFLGGPMDYTPGLFDTGYQPDKPFGTRAQQLALYVVFWSPMQMAADLYQAYEGEPAMQFIRNVPVGKWDETIVPQAEIGDYVVTARRQGRNWFVGAITNERGRTLRLPLDFLEKNTRYEVVVYGDGEDADFRKNPYPVKISRGKVDRGSTLTLRLKPGGGAAVEIYPVGAAHTLPTGDAGKIAHGQKFRLRAKHSGRLLTAGSGKITQQADNAALSQTWTLHRMSKHQWQILAGGKALTAAGREADSGLSLKPRDASDPLQRWHLHHIVGSWFRIYLADTDQVMDIKGIDYSDGGEAHLWKWLSKPNQVWSLERDSRP